MKRKVIFIHEEKDLCSLMVEALEHSPVGVYGIVNFNGKKKAIIKRGKELVVNIPVGFI